MLGFRPLASVPLVFFDPLLAALIASATFRFSDRGWISKPSDAPANANYLPRLAVPFLFERSIPLAPAAGGRLAAGYGEIVLANSDGALDATVRGFAIDGRRIAIRIGRPADGYAAFERLFEGTASGWRVADDNTVRIAVRDAIYKLEIPVQANLYGGGGGLDGTAELAGKTKPLALGRVLNVPPALVDPARLIYQAHDGPVQAIDAVYDQGLALGFAGDVADITLAAPAAGQFATQVSGGYLRLGAPPAGQITADLKGDAEGGVYSESTADIALRLARRGAALSDGEIDFASVERVRNAQPAPVGVYFAAGERRSRVEAIAALMAGIGGWVGASRLGQVQIGRLTWPPGDPLVELGPAQILNLTRLELPAELSPAPWRWRVAYQRNWTVQTSDLAGAVTAARRQFLAEGSRVAIAFDGQVPVRHLLAQEPEPVPGFFADAADANAEAARLLALWGGERRLFVVETKLAGYLIERLDTVRLVDHRFGLTQGLTGVVVGTRIDADRNQSTLTILV